MKKIKNVVLFAVAILLSITSMAQTKKDIIDIAEGSKEHTTLVQAIKAAELLTTFKGTGPFTLFAPNNSAFENLSPGTLDNLLKPENKSKLAGILKYHVVSGDLNADAISAAIKKGDGKTVLTTLTGEKLTATIVNGNFVLTDEKGGKATVTLTNLSGTNGVIHVIDSVLLPRD